MPGLTVVNINISLNAATLVCTSMWESTSNSLPEYSDFTETVHYLRSPKQPACNVSAVTMTSPPPSENQRGGTLKVKFASRLGHDRPVDTRLG